jgi:hypothetical protein
LLGGSVNLKFVTGTVSINDGRFHVVIRNRCFVCDTECFIKDETFQLIILFFFPDAKLPSMLDDKTATDEEIIKGLLKY